MIACAIALQDVMNRVSGQLDAGLRPAPARTLCPRQTDTDILSRHDIVLDRLRRDHLDARSTRLQAEREYGPGDGLSLLAADMEDSAWCALQTRLIELRADRAVMEKLAEARAEEERAADELTRQTADRRAREAFDYAQMVMRLRDERRQETDWLFILFLVMLAPPRAPLFRYQPAMAFNARAA